MATSNKEPFVIEGNIAVDDRGHVIFANDFKFEDIKRFYALENFSTDMVRAFHGHLKEHKYVFVVSGAAIVAAVEMDDVKAPSKNKKVHRFVLGAAKPAILFIPAGYANGFRALEKPTKVIFYSTSTLEESKGDDYRFPHDYWGKEIWEVEHR